MKTGIKLPSEIESINIAARVTRVTIVAFAMTFAILILAPPAKAAVPGTVICQLLLDAKRYNPTPKKPEINLRIDKDHIFSNVTIEEFVEIASGTARDIYDFIERLSDTLFVPDSTVINFSNDGTLLDSFCIPCSNFINLPQHAYTQKESSRMGVLAHEMGHLIFRENMIRLLRHQYRREITANPNFLLMMMTFEEIRKNSSDLSWLRSEMLGLENRYPALSNLEKYPFPDSVPIDVVAIYKTLSEVRKSKLAAGQTSVKALSLDDLFEHMIANEMDAFQEVFADLIAAIVTRNPNIMTEVLGPGFDGAIRSFDSKSFADLMKSEGSSVHDLIRGNADKNIPHLALFLMRGQIYDGYYRHSGKRIGQDFKFDARVARNVLETMGKVYAVMRVYPTSPKVRQATAFMTLKLSLPLILDTIEEESLKFLRSYAREELGQSVTLDEISAAIDQVMVPARTESTSSSRASSSSRYETEAKTKTNTKYRTMGGH